MIHVIYLGVIAALIVLLAWQRTRAIFWKQMWKIASDNAANMKAAADIYKSIGEQSWPEVIERKEI